MRLGLAIVPRALLASLIGLGLVVAVPDTASAETTMQLEVGFGGFFLPGRRVPVRVVVTADRLIKGTLEVTIEPTTVSGTVVDLPVEIPGASVKQYLIVMPTPLALDQGVIRVRLLAGDEVATTTAKLEYRADQELVGLLPAVTPSALPGATPLMVDAGTARFAAIDDEILAAAPGSLEPLGTIVAGPDELAGLAPGAREGLLHWVDSGGRLLIDASRGTTIQGLPDEWQPGEPGRVQAGGGEIRLTGGAAAAGQWSSILEPTPTMTPNDRNQFGTFFFAPEPLGNAIARDAGLETAKVGWLLGYLVVYVLLVGPIIYLILRRLRRPDASWLVVPALAVVFTLVSYVAGSDLRSDTRVAHGSVIITSPAGATARSWVGMVSRNGGDGKVTFPAGWTAGALDLSFTDPAAGSTTQVIRSADGVEGRIALDAGQFGVVAGTGSAGLEGGLEVTARSLAARTAVGTVKNTTAFPLDGVVVFIGRGAENVGSLAPGEEKEFSIDEGRFRDIFTPLEALAWPAESGWNGFPDLNSPVSLTLWQEIVRMPNVDFHAPGTAVAVGWTRSAASEAHAGGDVVSAGRTAIVTRAPVLAGEDGGVGALAVRRDMLRGVGFGFNNGFDPNQLVPTASSLFRFALPAGASVDPSALTLLVPEFMVKIEVWTPDGWSAIEDRTPDINPNNFPPDPSVTHELALPAAALLDGVVFARVSMRMDIGIADGSGFELTAMAA